MDALKEISEITSQRASILSNERFSKDVPQPGRQPPQDTYYFDHILFFFYGLSALMLFSFFLIANDFWMYKFRDVSQSTYNSSNKTDLQVYFASATSISQSLPSMVVTVLAALYGHKIHMRTRLLGIQVTCFLMFFVTTALVKVDTDTWQTNFFYLILVIYGVINVSGLFFQISVMSLFSKFPTEYTKSQMYGAGAAGIFSSILQIISLVLSGGSATTGALIYFGSGTAVIFITLVLTYLTKYSEHYGYYMGDSESDTKKTVYTLKETWETAKKIWSCVLICSLALSLLPVGHANITSLIVSEYYDVGSEWNKKYFVPVVTFMSPEIFSQLSRIVSRPIINDNNQWSVSIIFIIRAVLLGPIFMFCNTSPKIHSPLWFPHDWQYIIIMAVYSFSNSYFFSIAFLSVPRLVGQQTELAYILLQTCINLSASIVLPLSPLFIKLL